MSRRSTSRLLFLAVALSVGTVEVAAQPRVGVGIDFPTGPEICATPEVARFDREVLLRRTAELHPEVYRRLLLRDRSRRTLRLQNEAVVDTFIAFAAGDTSLGEVVALRVHTGARSRIWVDVRDTSRRRLMAGVPEYVRALESATPRASRDSTRGIIDNEVEVFGPIPTLVGDSIVDVLLFDIADPYVAGYFNPSDQHQWEGSNYRNLLYIDSWVQSEPIASVIAHELQHLIHNGLLDWPETFINEGASCVAEWLCGYQKGTNDDYLRKTNVSMFTWAWDGAERYAAYMRALTCLWYLYEQFGEPFLHALPLVGGQGDAALSVLERAMTQAAPSGGPTRWPDAALDWGIANYVQNDPNPRWSYRTKLASFSVPRAVNTRSYVPEKIPNHDTIVIADFGVAYYSYQKPGIIGFAFHGTGEFAAAVIRGKGAVTDVTLCSNYEENVVDGTGYDRVVVVIADRSGMRHTVDWDIRRLSDAPDESPPLRMDLK